MRIYEIEKVDESDVMFSIHNKEMYRVWFSDDEYDYIEDEKIIEFLNEFLKNK
jgi:hypothetical protein